MCAPRNIKINIKLRHLHFVATFTKRQYSDTNFRFVVTSSSLVNCEF